MIVNAIQSASYGPVAVYPPYLAKAAYPPKPPREPRRCRGHDGPETILVGMKKWLAWLIVGGPVVVYAIGKFLSR